MLTGQRIDLSSGDVFEHFEKLSGILRLHGYGRLEFIPGKRHDISNSLAFWPYELSYLKNLIEKKRNVLFEFSIFPHLYLFLRKIRNKEAFWLFNLFFLNVEIPLAAACGIFDKDSLDLFLKHTLLKSQGGSIRSNIKAVPYKNKLFFLPAKDIQPDENNPHFERDSVILADAILLHCRGLKFKRCLDIGTGCGIQAIMASDFTEECLAVDINDDYLGWARLNAKVNGRRNITFLNSDLFSDVHNKFDLIVSNPPYMLCPEEEKGFKRFYGGKYGIETTLDIAHRMAEYLADGGTALIITMSAVINRQDILIEHIRQIAKKDNSLSWSVFNIDTYRPNSKRYLDLYGRLNIDYFHTYIIKIENKKMGGGIVIRKTNITKQMISTIVSKFKS